jgi:hypothetical protein
MICGTITFKEKKKRNEMGSAAFLLAAAGLGVLGFSAKKGGILSNTPKEPPEFEQIRNKIKADLNFYFDANPANKFTFGDVHIPEFPDGVLVGSYFRKVPHRGQGSISSRERDQLSNCIEYAAKCLRNGANACDQKNKVTPGINDTQIITGASNILAAVIVYFFPDATPQQQAKMYTDIMKETNLDVRNLHWVQFMPYVMIALAAITAGVAIAGAPIAVSSTGVISGGTGWAGTGTLIGTIGTTLSTTIPAGVAIAGGIGAINGKPKNEQEAMTQLTQTFTALKEILK